MTRVSFTMRLRNEADVDEYLRRHTEIWPEMLVALRGAGIHNYNIYLHGNILFAYLEVEDFDRMVKTLATDPVNARWQVSMAHLIEATADPTTGFPRPLPEMFHMD